MDYKLIKVPGNTYMLQRVSDGAFIPNDSNNCDYQDYLTWVAQGNTAQVVG